jgi:predicted DNA-binding transcriptional regulator AlpA
MSKTTASDGGRPARTHTGVPIEESGCLERCGRAGDKDVTMPRATDHARTLSKAVDIIYRVDAVYCFPAAGSVSLTLVSPREALVGIAEIAEMFGVARNTAWRWSKRPAFPQPAARLASGPVWHREIIEAWASDHLPLQTGRPRKKSG